jgi:5-methylcytosine-specific restriction endonuclease McrA
MSFLSESIGKKFGRLEVLEAVDSGAGRWVARCKCDCGKPFIADPRMLKRGDTKSCGCLRRELASTRRTADLLGQKFGRLEVLAKAEIRGKNRMWDCRCECGELRTLSSNALLTGNTKSCGCLNKDQTRIAKFRDLSYTPIVKRYSSKAATRNLRWDLTPAFAEALIQQDCTYCGAPPTIRYGSQLPVNGIDRIDSSLAYTDSNVVACCKACNSAKGTMTVDEFKQWVERAHTRMNKGN